MEQNQKVLVDAIEAGRIMADESKLGLVWYRFLTILYDRGEYEVGLGRMGGSHGTQRFDPVPTTLEQEDESLSWLSSARIDK